ncbi:glycosyltransferase [Cumulibacter soli]|uniref:glycosyltransferase n=1 Tax=Cumulibacter soli TaxID=2546344 RepID=UPI00106755E1|nr:glycosyltransferase [Cumulibacter soli]
MANFVSPTSGGIRTVMRRLAHAQAADGVRSAIVVPGPDAGIATVPGVLAVGTLRGVSFAPGQPYRMVLNRSAVRQLLDELRPDVVEIHDQISLAWLGRECRERGIRTILIAHERLDLLARFWSGRDALSAPTKRWIARVGQSVDRVVAPSEFAAVPFRDAGIDVTVVHWGVDHAVFTPGPQRDSGRLRLVHAGRLSAEKDPLLSARTAELLAQRGIDVEVAVIGSGPEEKRFTDFRHAHLVGYLDGPHRMAQSLRAADVFLAPGPFETFGVSALEAMACGTPVVCRASGSIKEIPGTVAAPGTAAGFAEAVLKLSRSRPTPAEIAGAVSAYTWERAAREMLDVYEM